MALIAKAGTMQSQKSGIPAKPPTLEAGPLTRMSPYATIPGALGESLLGQVKLGLEPVLQNMVQASQASFIYGTYTGACCCALDCYNVYFLVVKVYRDPSTQIPLPYVHIARKLN